MKFKINIVVGVGLFLLLSGFITSDNDKFFEISKSIDVFGKVYREITLNYVDDVNPSEFMESGIKGMLSSLDPYTTYIDETMKKDIDLMTKGKYGGIGASVGIRNDDVTIIDLIEGYSAERQGLRIGDIIQDINGTTITKENYNDIGVLLKGKPGKVVKVKIGRDGRKEPLLFELVLEEVEVKNVTYYGFIPAESNNAYIKLSSFSRSAGNEVKNAILDLKSQKEIKSLVLDLRGNPGGLLDQAIDVSEKFLKKDQLIVSVRGRDTSKVTHYYAQEEPVAGDIDMIVLINGNSASASEIVAGAIQDHDRGVILGSQSFGKGLVQTLIPMSYNTSLKITTARYYTPSGRCIQRINYSDDNKVLSASMKEKEKTFKTDNNRAVYAAGGIEPDTIITNKSESKQVRRLIAQGMFFKFATQLYNSNPEMQLSSFSNEDYLTRFNQFLSSEGFEYSSETEQLISELLDVIEEEKFMSSLKIKVEELAELSNELKSGELKKYESDVVASIKKELAARISGMSGRIEQSLKFDNQFITAIDLLSGKDTYQELLSNNL
jgi:carboxyl-terminal processing protease